MNASNVIDVFLSRKSQDAHLAKILYDFLTSRGLNVFDSDHTLQELGNADYSRAIDDALVRAKHLIVVGSVAENIVSPWVESEWRFFLNRKRSGKAKGNLMSVVSNELKLDDLPPSLLYYEVIFLEHKNLDKIYSYVKRSQEDVVTYVPETLSKVSFASSPIQTEKIKLSTSRNYQYFVDQLGIKGDVEEFMTLRKAAEQGNAHAQCKLGFCYLAGVGGVKPSSLEAGRWFLKAAEQGHILAQIQYDKILNVSNQ